MGNLIRDIIGTEGYAELYIKHKVWVQHKRLPIRLLKDLPPNVALNLSTLFNEEWLKWLRRKK